MFVSAHIPTRIYCVGRGCSYILTINLRLAVTVNSDTTPYSAYYVVDAYTGEAERAAPPRPVLPRGAYGRPKTCGITQYGGGDLRLTTPRRAFAAVLKRYSARGSRDGWIGYSKLIANIAIKTAVEVHVATVKINLRVNAYSAGGYCGSTSHGCNLAHIINTTRAPPPRPPRPVAQEQLINMRK
ncbi:hypothetical protein EVAR_102761_1 [Eumeta japonica]|uniref:Uncharacterized protein n=1 Tax=Eumeta variegata TaxID=151549 RepID=A0A4C1THX1_EUMVA|nr:hypothetical protein EVAR_102761_1 [Eumeta japonica]